MEYIFGTITKKKKEVDILKTVGSEHTNLEGKHIIERKYSDSIITDTFNVEEKYLSKDGADGKKYDWYIISNHSRYIDYFTPQKAAIEGRIDDNEVALCDFSEDIEATVSDLENAICELSEIIEGGN